MYSESLDDGEGSWPWSGLRGGLAQVALGASDGRTTEAPTVDTASIGFGVVREAEGERVGSEENLKPTDRARRKQRDTLGGT